MNDPQPAEVVVVGKPEAAAPDETQRQEAEGIQHPAKMMRIGAMVRQLLEEVRHAPLDEASRTRLREIYENSIQELGEILSPDLREELGRLSLPFDEDVPSDAELRVAHAQLVGWLEGLFHGIQAMLFAQQAEMRERLEHLRRPPLPPHQAGGEEHVQGSYL